MKKRRVVIILAALLFTMSLCGCEKKEEPIQKIEFNTEASTQPANNENSSTSVDSSKTTTDSSSDSVESSNKTIQEEISQIQAKSDELDKIAQSCETQSDMNNNAADRYTLWDEELNSIWSRLSNELDAATKEKLLAEQREWIKRKDAAVEAAGMQAFGGSLQPLLEYCQGSDLTQVRVYDLAAILAQLHGETFTVSSEMQAVLDELDPSLDSVFSKFEGQYIFDIERGACIGVEKIADSAFFAEDLPEGATWVVWVTGGDVLTDKSVYSYTPSSITFALESGNYERMTENMAGGIDWYYGNSLDKLELELSAD